jgi:hypothetical protein
MPSRTNGRASVQLSCARHMIAALRDRCIRSTRPFAAGWKAVVRDSWIPHMLAREWKSCDSNCRPWSVVKVCGHPKRVIHPDTKARDTVTAVISGRGMSSGQRVMRSTAVRQYLKPPDIGSGPRMSTWTCWNGDVGEVKCPSGVVVCLVTLDRWQDWHVRAHVRQSFRMPGHT